jgi:large subunit ribosomal protein L15
MNLADARAAFIPKKRPKRLGRGWGSGHGKTSGHGNKGQQARSGGGRGPGFEGGQMPLYRRIPKRGFNNARFRVVYAIVNVGQLEGAFGEGATVDAAAIRDAHLVNALTGPIKILGGGDLSKKLHVTADRFSESAKRKIEASGGSVTALNPAPPPKVKKAPPAAAPKGGAAKEKGGAPEGASAPKAPKPKKPKAPPAEGAPEAPPRGPGV